MMKETSFRLTENVCSSVRCLLNQYTDWEMPPVDYLHLNENKFTLEEEEYETVVTLFLSIVKHRQFLRNVTNYFYCLGKQKNYSDQNSVIFLTHIVANVLNKHNKDEVINILRKEKLTSVLNLLKFFNRQLILDELFLAGCQYFEEEYVLDKIISNVKENKELLQDVLLHFEQLLEQKKQATKREVTKPVSPRFSIIHRPPPPPTNTPLSEVNQLPAPKPVPQSTYREPKVSKRLLTEQAQNRQQKYDSLQNSVGSLATLEHSDTNSSNISAARTTHADPEAPKPRPVIQYRKPKNDVPVKKNAATILREACRVIKEEEKEIQKVNELMKGAANYMNYEELLERARAAAEEAKLEDIEGKHLRGLLTREEAILARQRIADANKAKRAQIELERKETEEMLKQMRQKHDEKLKEVVEKTQQIQKNIEEKKKNLINEKQKIAHEVTDMNRQLYDEAVLKQKEELEKRIEIIKEIKALTSIKDFQENKFDPTETMNFGLLCEMSLTELQERLLINRAALQEEIEKRQNCIRKQREKQHRFLADTEQFIQSCRQQKKLMNTMVAEKQKQPKKIQESKEIMELREKLQKARIKRIELQKN